MNDVFSISMPKTVTFEDYAHKYYQNVNFIKIFKKLKEIMEELSKYPFGNI